MRPFDLADLVEPTDGRILPDAASPMAPLVAVTADSRDATPNSLYVALVGPHADGHDYVNAAFERGATAAVVSEAWAVHHPPPEGRAYLVAPDTEAALGAIAGWSAARMPARRVGLTGSSGKTTTKELLAAMLGAAGPTLRNPGNQNGETGVPLALLRLEERHQFAVLEMGMRGLGQIRALAEVTRPELGLITNIGRSHLELLGSLEAIARAKGELLETLPETGAAVLPAEDAFLPLLRSLCRCPVLTFGLGADADVHASAIESSGQETAFRVTFPDGAHLSASVPLLGAHNVLNATAALAAAWRLGVNPEVAASGLAVFTPPAMRSHMVETPGGIRLFHDAYNANPDSMRAALAVLKEQPPRRIAVLGDMLEIGPTEAAEHYNLGREVAHSADLLIAVGPRSRAVVEGARDAGLPDEVLNWWETSADAAREIVGLAQPGDTVLVKGSRGMKMESVADALLEGDA